MVSERDFSWTLFINQETQDSSITTTIENTQTKPNPIKMPPTRFFIMELPTFQRNDVDGWILECDKYFDLDETPESQKIVMASRQLDEKAYLWHLVLMEEVNGRVITWSK